MLQIKFPEKTPQEKLKEVCAISDQAITKWLWIGNRDLGGSIPFYYFGTDREHKAIAAFKSFVLRNKHAL